MGARRRRARTRPSPAPSGWLRRAWKWRLVRLGAAALLVLAVLGMQLWLYGQPVAVTLPADDTPVALEAATVGEALVIHATPAPTLVRTSAVGAALARIDFEAAVPSSELAAVFRLAGQEPPARPTPMGYRQDGEAEQPCPAELRVEVPTEAAARQIWLYQSRTAGERAGVCSLHLRLPAGAQVVVATAIGDLGAAPCWRQLWSAAAPRGFRVQDPLVARFELPAGDVARLRFAPKQGACRPLVFEPALALEVRQLHWPADALRPSFDHDRAAPIWSVHAARGDQPLALEPLAGPWIICYLTKKRSKSI